MKLQVAGRKSPKRTKESDIPDVIVKLFEQRGSRRKLPFDLADALLTKTQPPAHRVPERGVTKGTNVA